MRYCWKVGGVDHELEMVRVALEVGDFYMASVPVTQALWTHVMGDGKNPALHVGMQLPVENVSWDQIHAAGGFLERINESAVFRAMAEQQVGRGGRFRLPTEAEWEYAARGGPHWQDGYRWSGSNDVDAVAWHDRKHGDHTQPVALKAPNQLGIFDLSGNVWEWCEDVYTGEGAGTWRVLRGGCFHNWAVHCTVSKRYAIGQDCHDGCIGLRLVFG